MERRWTENGEVDIMEYYRHEGIAKILANTAWKEQDQWQPVWDSERIPLCDFLENDPEWLKQFHVWKMHWTEDFIRLYLDERFLNEIDLSEADYEDGFNPFRQPHYILLNLAIGSNGGDPSSSQFPLKYEVDYVRVFSGKSRKQRIIYHH